MNQQTEIIWDKGSAYDLFVSLRILHRPDEYGLRPSWAAGVRSRMPIALRDVLEHAQNFLSVPLHWIYNLPEPKDAETALAELRALPPEDRLPALVFATKEDERSTDFKQFLMSLEGKKRLSAKVEAHIKQYYRNPDRITREFIREFFDAWTKRTAFGEELLEALEAYIENFFQEEELRILPAQSKALNDAQGLAEKTDVLSLLEELSTGVRMEWIADVSTVILAPSFWGAPFVFFENLDQETGLVLFGARPKGSSLVPGEMIPEELLNALKALADPTRLRIMRYLLEDPCSPSELAKILRLRPPTVIHHLHILRLAGLVGVKISPQTERCYAVRFEGIDATIQHLKDFLPGE